MGCRCCVSACVLSRTVMLMACLLLVNVLCNVCHIKCPHMHESPDELWPTHALLHPHPTSSILVFTNSQTTQDSIKSSSQWFMACGPNCAPGLARMMAVRCCGAVSEYDKTLHVLYLANDILFKGWVG